MKSPAQISITSMAEYFSAIQTIWDGWTAACKGTIPDIWFRGHSDARWALRPSALREPFDTFSEHRLRHDFLLKSQPYLTELSSPPQNNWDWYFLMQHYGVPTRLLDWTESALVALYFALRPGSGTAETSACVWLLHPRAMNSHLSDGMIFVPIYTDKSIARYLPDLWDESSKSRLPNPPIAIDPPANSPRISAQRGKFTVHGRVREPLDVLLKGKEGLRRLDIPADAKAGLRRQFLITGISEGTLFPGLHGVASEITGLYSRSW